MKGNPIHFLGSIRNISLDGRHLLKGWFLLIDQNGRELLVRRNYSLSFRYKMEVYETDYNFSDHQIDYERFMRTPKSSILILLTVIAGSLFRILLPIDFIFGATNESLDVAKGLVNVLLVILAIAIYFFLFSVYRWWRIKYFLKQAGANLTYIGKIKPQAPLTFSPSKKGNW